jgi:hypothetical protein
VQRHCEFRHNPAKIFQWLQPGRSNPFRANQILVPAYYPVPFVKLSIFTLPLLARLALFLSDNQ